MFPKIHTGLSQTQKAQKHKNSADKCVSRIYFKAPPPFVITYSFVC